MKMVLVPADVLTATVRYLVQRPYAEVAQIVPALMAAKEAPNDELPKLGPTDDRGTPMGDEAAT